MNKRRGQALNACLLIFRFCCFSDKKTGTLVLICELMDMNIYELIRGKWQLLIIWRLYMKYNQVVIIL